MVQMSARIPKDRAFMMNSRPVYMVFVLGTFSDALTRDGAM